MPAVIRLARLWISYSRNGHQIRESANTTDQRKAVKLLQQRLGEKDKPTFVGPSEKRLTLDDLEAQLKPITFDMIGAHFQPCNTA
jgi:hypothetical protein